jgi:hypothetical protein
MAPPRLAKKIIIGVGKPHNQRPAAQTATMTR